MENGTSRGPDSVKLFVGQLPKQMSEQQLAEVFAEAGTVYEINIIKDKLTKQSRGMFVVALAFAESYCIFLCILRPFRLLQLFKKCVKAG